MLRDMARLLVASALFALVAQAGGGGGSAGRLKKSIPEPPRGHVRQGRFPPDDGYSERKRCDAALVRSHPEGVPMLGIKDLC